MAYDGKVMREALQRFEEDKQRRASQAAARRQRIYREVPRLEEIEQQLRGTMGRIMAQALRRGRTRSRRSSGSGRRICPCSRSVRSCSPPTAIPPTPWWISPGASSAVTRAIAAAGYAPACRNTMPRSRFAA